VQIDADVLARQVDARRHARLEQQARARGLGHDVAADLDPDRSRRLADVDAMERIARVTFDPLVLLVPLVERVEVQHQVPGQVVVRGPEAGADAIVDRDRLAGGRVHAEGDPRVQHAGHLAVRRRCRRQLGPDVVDRHGEGGADTARLPDEERSRAVDDRVRAEARPDPLLDRLVAKLATGLGQ
jgi:hypothetical protein